MSKIKVPVAVYMVELKLKEAAEPAVKKANGALVLQSLLTAKTLPSSWKAKGIKVAFEDANAIWAKAQIEFEPGEIQKRSLAVPADDDGMWKAFVNMVYVKKGIAASFVFDLPAHEAGWGGGRTAVVSGEKVRKGNDFFPGRVLAHELGHCLLGSGHEEDKRKNLMYHYMNPQKRSSNELTPDQIAKGRKRAEALSKGAG